MHLLLTNGLDVDKPKLCSSRINKDCKYTRQTKQTGRQPGLVLIFCGHNGGPIFSSSCLNSET